MSNPPDPGPAPATPPAQPYGPYPQAPYGAPPGYYAAPPPTNALSIVALVLSLIGISIGAVICGHISLGQIKRTGEQGHGLAVAGLVIGYVGCAGWILFWVVWLSAIIIPLVMVGSVASTTDGFSTP